MSAGARPPTHACSTTTSRRPSRRVRAGRRRPSGRRAPAVRPSASAARSTASASCDGIMAVRRNAMTTDTYDWTAIVDGLNRFLRLRSIPIGMKLFETVEAMEAIPKIRRPKAKHTTDCVPHGRYRAMAVSPLTAGRLDPPDICLIYGTPGQMIFFINGLQWTGYRKLSFTSVGESACADSWGKALETNGLRYPVPPYGIQSDAGAGLAVSYAAKEAKPR